MSAQWQQPTLADTGVAPSEAVRCACGRKERAGRLIDLRAVPVEKRPTHRADFACSGCVRHAQTLGLHDADELLQLQGAPPEVVEATKPFADHLRAQRTARLRRG